MSVLEVNMTLKYNINKEQDFTSEEVPIFCKLIKTIQEQHHIDSYTLVNSNI